MINRDILNNDVVILNLFTNKAIINFNICFIRAWNTRFVDKSMALILLLQQHSKKIKFSNSHCWKVNSISLFDRDNHILFLYRPRNQVTSAKRTPKPLEDFLSFGLSPNWNHKSYWDIWMTEYNGLQNQRIPYDAEAHIWRLINELSTDYS